MNKRITLTLTEDQQLEIIDALSRKMWKAADYRKCESNPKITAKAHARDAFLRRTINELQLAKAKS